MKTLAYCAQSFASSMQAIAGVVPLTCPPLQAATFDPTCLQGYNLIFFDLHGEPGEAQWYGDVHLPALTADQLRQADLQGTVVFGLNCYLADQVSPMLEALLDAKASCVIAGDGQNFAGSRTIFGCGELAKWFRIYLNREQPSVALWRAKQSTQNDLRGQPELLQDMLGFKMFYREKGV